MADDGTDSVNPAAQGDAAALHAALGSANTSDEAREYLKKQSRLADLQIDNLTRQDEFELSHLRFRRFSDWAKFALEVAGGLVVLLIVCGLGTMVWNASRDRDLVVDAFSVPQDVAQSGMTGSVLAGRVLDGFGRKQSGVRATTQAAGSYRADAGDTVRVEIPDTGISLGELNRYLRAWLGHATHVTGDLVHTSSGFALTTRFGNQPGFTVEGKPDELDKLIDKSAERLFAQALPYRYIEYLVRQQRFAEAQAIVPRLAAQGSAQDRALAYSAWANLRFFEGDMRGAEEKGREAVRLDPGNPVNRAWLAVAEGNLDHENAAWENEDAAIRLWSNSSNGTLGGDLAASGPVQFTAYRDENADDFEDAVRTWTRYFEISPAPDNATLESAAQDAAAAHELARARHLISLIKPNDRLGRPDAQLPLAQFYFEIATGNWSEAVDSARRADAILRNQPDQKWTGQLMMPDLAYALAKSGDLRGAAALIASTPHDCDNCMRRRGQIAAIAGSWPEAVADLAAVAARSPHESDAETQWGEILLHRGDPDGAIAKFVIANRKSRHFADPLELWGEALMLKNRSDLALAKFEEANKYAPSWGRLHLKWGEALWWSGDKAGAKKQFAAAAVLDLTPSEKIERTRMAHG
ncbi:MAG TPA: hypothetical protein VGG10_11795 [Rhizomicrobium sp.]|jgi:thioredoxin-like negative regulator of GroEL